MTPPRSARALAAAFAALIVCATVAAASSAPAAATSASAAARPIGHGVVRYDLRPNVPRPDAADIVERARRSELGSPLLLFLPATRAVPSDYRAFLSTAAQTGYHVLALDYHNTGLSIARTCERDADCYTRVQTNRFDGGEPSRFSAVPPRAGILHRFVAAIDAAQHRDPAGGWRAYIHHDAPEWSRIVLAGHSQGGGEAAFIAHLHRVRGVLFFSAPVDDDQGVLPTWMRLPGATPVSRMYGFDDDSDVYASRIRGSWSALGLGGSVDEGTPSGSAHLLGSRLALGTPGQAHDRSVTDASPGVGHGHPVFLPQWRWMLTHAAGRHTTSAHDTGSTA